MSWNDKLLLIFFVNEYMHSNGANTKAGLIAQDLSVALLRRVLPHCCDTNLDSAPRLLQWLLSAIGRGTLPLLSGSTDPSVCV